MSPSSKPSHGILYILGVTLFTVSVIAAVGVFAFQQLLQGQITGMADNLAQARTSLQPDVIKNLARTNDRFTSATEIINKHQTVSSFLDLLGKLTLQSVRFSSLSYDASPTGITIKMKGEAKSYASVALQSKIISGEPLFLTSQFSGFDLNDTGNVTFTLDAALDPKAVSYKAAIDALNPPAAPTAGASDTSTTNSAANATSSTTQ